MTISDSSGLSFVRLFLITTDPMYIAPFISFVLIHKIPWKFGSFYIDHLIIFLFINMPHFGLFNYLKTLNGASHKLWLTILGKDRAICSVEIRLRDRSRGCRLINRQNQDCLGMPFQNNISHMFHIFIVSSSSFSREFIFKYSLNRHKVISFFDRSVENLT